MRKKLKIIKVVSNQPMLILSACADFGDCKAVGNTVYIATQNYLKDIKDSLHSLFITGYVVSVVKTYNPELLQWIEDLQINNVIKQIKNYKK
jgi:hypothetical protein